MMEFLSGLKQANQLGVSDKEFRMFWEKEVSLKITEETNKLQQTTTSPSQEYIALNDVVIDQQKHIDIQMSEFRKEMRVMVADLSNVIETVHQKLQSEQQDMRNYLASSIELTGQIVYQQVAEQIDGMKMHILRNDVNSKPNEIESTKMLKGMQPTREQQESHLGNHQQEDYQQTCQGSIDKDRNISEDSTFLGFDDWSEETVGTQYHENPTSKTCNEEHTPGSKPNKPLVNRLNPCPVSDSTVLNGRRYEQEAPPHTGWKVGTEKGCLDVETFAGMNARFSKLQHQSTSRTVVNNGVSAVGRGTSPLTFPKDGALIQVNNVEKLGQSGHVFESRWHCTDVGKCKVRLRLWFSSKRRLCISVAARTGQIQTSPTVLLSGTGSILNVGSRCYTPLWNIDNKPYKELWQTGSDTELNISICLASSRAPVEDITYEILQDKRYMDNNSMSLCWNVKGRICNGSGRT